MKDPLRAVCVEDGRFAYDAFRFLYESLERSVTLAGRQAAEGADRHVSGDELLQGMRVLAGEMFGPLAAQVWRSWGVQSTLDWGHIVFLLVEAQLLNRQESDQLGDFAGVYDFDQVFVQDYKPRLPAELGARPAVDEGPEGSQS